MPEGHTIHRLARDQSLDLVGQEVHARSPQGRFDDGAAELDGRRVLAVEAIGKHLVLRFEDGPWLHVHLGLFGRFRRFTVRPPPEPRGATRLRLETARVTWDLSGPTICALIDDEAVQALKARLGPDVLGAPDANAARLLRDRIRKSSKPIGVLLLDQSIVAGVGNVYRAEALFLCGVHPSTPGRDLDARTVTRLWKTLVRLLQAGVEARRIVTVEGAKKRGQRTWVHGRSTCQRCAGPVTQLKLGARTAWFCATCQPGGGLLGAPGSG